MNKTGIEIIARKITKAGCIVDVVSSQYKILCAIFLIFHEN